MIVISKTPLRISFCGGGTDVKEFFENEWGCVVNTTIDKYIYIAIHKYYDKSKIFLKYSETEMVDDVNKIRHPLFREALKITGVKGVEITSFADIPSTGSGLGSSSTFLVGLLNALFAYNGTIKSPDEIARLACTIERDILKEKGGYQDQYISAHGGLKYITFNQDGTVFVNPILMPREARDKLNSKLMMFYTGIARNSSSIHQEQDKNTPNNMEYLRKMKELAVNLKSELERGNVAALGKALHDNWLLKKRLCSMISNDAIESTMLMLVKLPKA